MNTNDGVESGNALFDCLDAVATGQRKLPQEFNAEFMRRRIHPSLWIVFFTVSRRSSSDLPMLDCDSDVMKGFGIPFSNFDPKYQRFTFHKDSNTLRITDDKYQYDFMLSNIQTRKS